MAIEIQVRSVTNRPHSGLARRHFWSQGEVVNVRPFPNSGWGRLDTEGFWIIRIDGIDIDDSRVQLLQETGLPDLGEPEETRTNISRRRRYIDVASLPAAMRDELRSTGRLTVDLSGLTAFDGARKERIAERTDDNEVQP